MRLETKFIIFLFILSLTLAGFGFYIKSYQNKTPALRPFANSIDIFSLFRTYEKPKYTIYGYLPYWNFVDLKYLQLDKVTDIAYFGLYIDDKGDFVKTTTDENDILITEPGYNNWKSNEKIIELISECKKHDVNFALTVIAHTDSDNDSFLSCRECWDNLYNNLIIELDEKKIKDVNLNFEYAQATEEESAVNFALFTKYLNERLDKRYINSKVVVSAFADSVNQKRVSSKVTELANYSDGIFIMAYDFHRPASDNAGPVSPIDGKGINDDYDIRTMINDYLTQAPPNKLILGVPYYGYNWVVESDVPRSKRIEGNDSIGFSQSQSYASVMNTILEVKPKILWDEVAKVPYFTYISPETGSIRQAYFENKESLREKYKLVKDNNLSGVGIWALGYDEGYTELWDLLYEELIK